MAKRTAVIDIGSNSARMVVFERTSRFGFFLLNETRSRVRISEGAYENGGNLQEPAIQRAVTALEEFLAIAKNLKVRKILAVATSAVRDAPNRKIFLKRVEKELGLKIKVIDGDKEAWLGGTAAVNLLPVTDAVSIDIGGGSTDLALIRDREVVATHSLKLGTVRLKELFFDKKRPLQEAVAFVEEALSSLPPEFLSAQAVGIGGTVRAISKAIMQRREHPIERVHAFAYSLEEEKKFIDKVARASVMKLGKLGIKKERIDTIRPGALIFSMVLARIGAREVITGGAGIREGLFLSDLLRNQRGRFPANFNPSVKSLQDRFCTDTKLADALGNTAGKIFDVLAKPFGLNPAYRPHVITAAKLSRVGIYLNYYGYHRHSACFLLNNLDYGFTHEEMILIATLVRFNKRRLPKTSFTRPYKGLLPESGTLSWLSYIVSLAQAVHTLGDRGAVVCEYSGGVLICRAPFGVTLAGQKIKELEKPAPIAVRLERIERSKKA